MVSLFLGVLAVVVVQAGASIAERALLADLELTAGVDGTTMLDVPPEPRAADIVFRTVQGRSDAVASLAVSGIIGEPGVRPVNEGGSPLDENWGGGRDLLPGRPLRGAQRPEGRGGRGAAHRADRRHPARSGRSGRSPATGSTSPPCRRWPRAWYSTGRRPRASSGIRSPPRCGWAAPRPTSPRSSSAWSTTGIRSRAPTCGWTNWSTGCPPPSWPTRAPAASCG